jgi:hypothetical protein
MTKLVPDVEGMLPGFDGGVGDALLEDAALDVLVFKVVTRADDKRYVDGEEDAGGGGACVYVAGAEEEVGGGGGAREYVCGGGGAREYDGGEEEVEADRQSTKVYLFES